MKTFSLVSFKVKAHCVQESGFEILTFYEQHDPAPRKDLLIPFVLRALAHSLNTNDLLADQKYPSIGTG